MQSSVSIIKKGWLRVILFLLCYLLLMFFVHTLVSVVVTLLFKGDSSLNFLYTGILLNFFISLLLVFFFRKTFDRQSFFSLGFAWKGFGKERTAGFFTGLLLITIIATVLWLMRLLEWFTADVDAAGILMVFALLVLVSFAEELVFRGYILNNLMQSLPKESALIVSALLFTLFHSLNPDFNLIGMMNIFLAGILLGINYIHTKNLWFAIFFHFSWNFFQGPVLGFQVSGLELPALLQQNSKGSVLLTGGPFGPEASLLATIVMSITAIILYLLFQKKYRLTPVEE